MFDILVVGSGFAGATFAREMAEQGKKVLVVEKRPHIGGNMFEEFGANGIRIHKYGPHIFHTNNLEVFQYLKKFSKWYDYEHKVVGKIDGKLVPIPYNFKSIDLLFENDKASQLKTLLTKYFGENNKASIYDLINHEDEKVREFGEHVFEKVFANYTAKQWGVPVSEIDKSTINRVPVVIGYDDRYFQDQYQAMPQDGFTVIFENMLSHPNIQIDLGTDIKDRLEFNFKNGTICFDGQAFDGPIMFSGAIDALLDYKYGMLPYRSLELVFEDYDVTYYQQSSVVNYPNEQDFTRITEFKYLTRQQLDGKTTILKEYPLAYGQNIVSDPYYPIINDKNLEIYEKYMADLAKFENVHLCGRLAEYKYYNMDAVVASALDLAKKVASK